MGPPFLVQLVFGLLGGIGEHPEDVARMKRTADPLFGDDYRWPTRRAKSCRSKPRTKSRFKSGLRLARGTFGHELPARAQ